MLCAPQPSGTSSYWLILARLTAPSNTVRMGAQKQT
jgi:hypothetical protein